MNQLLKLAEFKGLEQRCRKKKVREKTCKCLEGSCVPLATYSQASTLNAVNTLSARDWKCNDFEQRLFLESSTQQSCRIILQLALAKKKKMPKRVGASTQPCFTPFLIGKEPEAEPSYWTVPCMSSWKDVIILRSLDGDPILCRRVNRPFLLIRSKALVGSIKAIYSGFLYSRHFSCSCLSEKIVSIVDFPALNRTEPQGTPFPLPSPTC